MPPAATHRHPALSLDDTRLEIETVREDYQPANLMRFPLGERPGELHRTKGNCLDFARCQTGINERVVHGWTERT